MSRTRVGLELGVAVLLLGAAARAEPPATQAAQPPRIYGGLERVKIVSVTPIEVPARLDSGAEASVLYAGDIKYLNRPDSSLWVAFTVDSGSVVGGKQVSYKLPVLRDVLIHRDRNGGTEHEPIVALELCIGDRDLPVEVGLRNRGDYTAPLVLGRPELARLGPVDVQKQFTVEPGCAPPAAVPQSPAQSRP